MGKLGWREVLENLKQGRRPAMHIPAFCGLLKHVAL
jgi:hypothetical protein